MRYSSSPESPEWAALAPDVLRQIFSLRQPLQLELRLVCQAWASAFMPLLTHLTAHSTGVWEHSRLGGSSLSDVSRLTRFCSLQKLDLRSLDGSLRALPPLPRLRELNLGKAQLCPSGMERLRCLVSLETLHLEITDTLQQDIMKLQELSALRCLAIMLRPEWGSLDTLLQSIGDFGGLTQLTGFTVLVDSPYTCDIMSHVSAQYGWMANLRSLEVAAVGPLCSEDPQHRLPIDMLMLTELRRLCDRAPQLRSLTLTTRYCDVHLADFLASLTGLTALNLTMADGWGVKAEEPFQRLPLQVITSLQFWDACSYRDPYPFQLCVNLVSLTCFKPMTGGQIRHLVALSRLRTLELQRGVEHSCTPAEISNLGRLTGLVRLQIGFHSCAHPLDCMRSIGRLSRLRQLGLDMPWRSYQAMAMRDPDCLGCLRGLQASLDVSISHVLGAMNLRPLLGLPGLTRLEVSHSSRKYWAPAALRGLAVLTSLRELVIHRIADADAPLLAALTQLTHLRMVGKSKASSVFRTKHKRRTDTLSKLPQLLYFSTARHD